MQRSKLAAACVLGLASLVCVNVSFAQQFVRFISADGSIVVYPYHGTMAGTFSVGAKVDVGGYDSYPLTAASALGGLPTSFGMFSNQYGSVIQITDEMGDGVGDIGIVHGGMDDAGVPPATISFTADTVQLSEVVRPGQTVWLRVPDGTVPEFITYSQAPKRVVGGLAPGGNWVSVITYNLVVQENTTLIQENTTLTNQVTTLTQTIAQKDTVIAQKDQQINTLTSQVTTLTQQKTELEQILAGKNVELATLLQRAQTAEALAASRLTEINNLNTTLTSKNQQIVNLGNKLKARDKTITTLRGQLKTKNATISKLNKDVKKWKKLANKRLRTIKKLRKQINGTSAAVASVYGMDTAIDMLLDPDMVEADEVVEPDTVVNEKDLVLPRAPLPTQDDADVKEAIDQAQFELDYNEAFGSSKKSGPEAQDLLSDPNFKF